MFEDQQQTNNQPQNTPQQAAPQVPPNNTVPESIVTPSVGSSGGGKGKTIGLVVGILLVVVLGIGGWWYYAYGQTMMFVKDIQWHWGQDALENYEQSTEVNINIKQIRDQAHEQFSLNFFGDSFDVGFNSKQSFVGADSEGNFDINFSTNQDFDFNLGLNFKMVRNQYFLKLSADNLDQLTGGFFALPDSLTDNWIEIPLDSGEMLGLSEQSVPEDLEVDDEKVAKIHQEVDNFLQTIKSKKIFKAKDTKEMEGNSKKIQFILNPDKLDDLIFAAMETQTRVYKIVYGEDYDLYGKKSIEELKADFEKFRREKPDQWEQMKDDLSKVILILHVDKDTKYVTGVEIIIDNMKMVNGGSETLLNANAKFKLYKIEPYAIVRPQNAITLEELMNDFTSSMSGAFGEVPAGLDTIVDTDGDSLPDVLEGIIGSDINDTDTDGDGYIDGQEFFNGYDPLGEGEMDPERFDEIMEQWSAISVQPDTSDIWDIQRLVKEGQYLCEDSGGTWVYAGDVDDVDASVDQCLLIDMTDGCDSADECIMYSLGSGDVCAPRICDCPEGETFSIDSFAVNIGCR